VLPTFQRNQVVDFTSIWVFDNVAFLIPVPDETANINAVVKPFQWPVRKKYKSYKYFYKIKHSLFNQQIWVGIGVSIVCVIVVLSLIQRYLEYQTAGQLTDDGGGLRIITKTITGKHYLNKVWVWSTFGTPGSVPCLLSVTENPQMSTRRTK
jgi:hypothetical protein